MALVDGNIVDHWRAKTIGGVDQYLVIQSCCVISGSSLGCLMRESEQYDFARNDRFGNSPGSSITSRLRQPCHDIGADLVAHAEDYLLPGLCPLHA